MIHSALAPRPVPSVALVDDKDVARDAPAGPLHSGRLLSTFLASADTRKGTDGR